MPAMALQHAFLSPFRALLIFLLSGQLPIILSIPGDPTSTLGEVNRTIPDYVVRHGTKSILRPGNGHELTYLTT